MAETSRSIQDGYLISAGEVLQERPPRSSDVGVNKATYNVLAAMEGDTAVQITAVMIGEKLVGPGRNQRKAFLEDDRSKAESDADARMEAASSALANIMIDRLKEDPQILSGLPKSVTDGHIEFKIPLSECNIAGIGGISAYSDAGLSLKVNQDGSIDINISQRPDRTLRVGGLNIVDSQRDNWLRKMLLLAKGKFIQQLKDQLKIKGTLMMYGTSEIRPFEGLDSFDRNQDRWVMGSDVTFDPVEEEKVNAEVCLWFNEHGFGGSRGAMFDIEHLGWKGAAERTS